MNKMLEVIRPGLLTTVQDLGRTGGQSYGITSGGAADPTALSLANRLVGNASNAAALEMTIIGPVLKFHGDSVVALTGADFEADLEGEPLPVGRSVAVPDGTLLRLRTARRGCRGYLAVAGGLDVPEVFGSRSTDLIAGVGGWRGRPLQEGDRLPLGRASQDLAGLAGRSVSWGFVPANEPVLRVVLGPQQEMFPPTSLQKFFSEPFNVSERSNRMGIRLEGPRIAWKGREILSEAQPLGAVQVPQDGCPIILGVDRATVGGYPKIGVLASVDTWVLGQLRPGDRLRFRQVTPDEARTLWRRRQLQLQSILP